MINVIPMGINMNSCGPSLVAQWLRIHLPTQGAQVWSLVQEDPTCCGATKPVATTTEAHVLQLLKPVRLEPVLHNKRSHHKWEARAPQRRVAPRSLQLEKTHMQQRGPNATKKEIKF